MKFTKDNASTIKFVIYNNNGQILTPDETLFTIEDFNWETVYTETVQKWTGNEYTSSEISFSDFAQWEYDYFADGLLCGSFSVVKPIVTTTELIWMKLWLDFSSYSIEEIWVAIDTATTMIERYLWYKLVNGLIEQEWRVWVNHVGDIVIPVKRKIWFVKVVSLKLRVPWVQEMPVEMSVLNVDRKAWLVVYPTIRQTYTAYPSRIVSDAEYLNYRMKYIANEDSETNLILKKAIWMICVNMYRADKMAESSWLVWTWAASWGTVKSFSSWKYSVAYGWQEWISKAGSSARWYFGDDFLTDNVRALLAPLKRSWQNTL